MEERQKSQSKAIKATSNTTSSQTDAIKSLTEDPLTIIQNILPRYKRFPLQPKFQRRAKRREKKGREIQERHVST